MKVYHGSKVVVEEPAMIANQILLQRKYARVIAAFAEKCGLTLNDALDFFYRSQEYQLLRAGIADLHCMSDDYLAEDLKEEYDAKIQLIGLESKLNY